VVQAAGITLVLGGARSGKSAVAERLVASAAGDDPVAYLATGPVPDPAADPSWAARVAAHRTRRPAAWRTIEVGDGQLGPALLAAEETVLVDSLGTWLAGLAGFGPDASAELLAALEARRTSGRTSVVVSEEVGLGVHPSTALGGAFRDALGELNQAVAGAADDVLLVVAGRFLPLLPGTP